VGNSLPVREMKYDSTDMHMQFISRFLQIIVATGLIAVSTPLLAVNSVATVAVKVNRFLAMANVSEMNFGAVSINSVAGAVTLKPDGTRESTGGVMFDQDGSFSLARFMIEGAQDADYSVSYPEQVLLSDGNGNSLVVDQFNGELFDAGETNSNGLRELVVGGRLNLEAYQAVGKYNGSLVVEVEYR